MTVYLWAPYFGSEFGQKRFQSSARKARPD